MTSKDYWSDHVGDDMHESENKIHDWLTFFLVIVGINIARAVLNITFNFDMEDYLNNSLVAASDITAALGAIVLGTYTIIAFRRRMRNAVLVGNMFIITELIFKLLGLVFLSQTTEAFNPWIQLFTPVAWAAIWLSFLAYSQQVMRLFPTEKRCAGRFDYMIGAACVIVPGVLLWMGLNSM